MGKKISFHFDVASPFSYLGFKQLLAFQKLPQWPSDLAVEFVPIFFPGILKLSGNPPPVSNPLKGAWLGKDLKLSSAVHGVPIKILPSVGFPLNTLACMRILTVIKELNVEILPQAIDALFTGYWAQDLDVSKPEVIAELLSPLASKAELFHLFELSSTDKYKEHLKQTTANLVSENKAFGVPWMIVLNDKGKATSFFGSDRWDNLFGYLGIPSTQLNSLQIRKSKL